MMGASLIFSKAFKLISSKLIWNSELHTTVNWVSTTFQNIHEQCFSVYEIFSCFTLPEISHKHKSLLYILKADLSAFGAHGSEVVKALSLQTERSRVQFQMRWFFLIYLILPSALCPRVYSACNRNEYQKHKNNNVSWRVKCFGSVGLTTLPPSVSLLSRQCGILYISQHYRPQRHLRA
jgi:hypothetical protein